MHSAAFRPSLRSACVTPTVTVDFPSPAGVGLIPVTSTNRPLGLRRANACRRIFALYLPYSSTSSSSSPSSAAIAATGRSFAACAMAISVGTFAVVVTDPFALERGCEPRPEHATGVLRGPVRDLPDRRPARPRARLGVLVRGARVDHDRLPELGGQRQLGLESAPLRVAGRVVVMVIEAGLSDSHHFG